MTRLRSWNSTTAGRLSRGVAALTGAMRAIDVGPLGAQKPGRQRTPSGAWRAFDKLRTATPDVVQRAVARVATYSTLHLYRGELFTRNVRETGEPRRCACARAPRSRRCRRPSASATSARLDLQEAYCRQKWDRGDTVVLATSRGQPAGIVWCARTPVYVPDIGREVRPGAGECYIHDVYVHPDERGRQVAPAMLDFLARELRRARRLSRLGAHRAHQRRLDARLREGGLRLGGRRGLRAHGAGVAAHRAAARSGGAGLPGPRVARLSV